jgi:hypothetical protein
MILIHVLQPAPRLLFSMMMDEAVWPFEQITFPQNMVLGSSRWEHGFQTGRQPLGTWFSKLVLNLPELAENLSAGSVPRTLRSAPPNFI